MLYSIPVFYLHVYSIYISAAAELFSYIFALNYIFRAFFMEVEMKDSEYMSLAIELAKKGYGTVSPNPVAGAVIVKNGRIIGQGYHEKYGGLHAERNALLSCSESPEGATMYVTLEPCCHYGKQPPCTEAIIEAALSRVVVGVRDPNPLVAGKGIEILKEHGISVTEDVMTDECRRINEVFMHYIQTGTPFVVMKYAMTIDGKIACYTGDSKWVTGEAARNHVHLQRHRYSAIMAGIGTVLADDPLLTCRTDGGVNPVRIICDTHLRIPLSSQIVRTAREVPTIIVTCSGDEDRKKELADAGCRLIVQSPEQDSIDLPALMDTLGKEGIDSILLEGGGTLNWSALESGIVNKVQAYIAPKLFGGSTAKTPVEGAGFSSPDLGVHLKNPEITVLGSDFLIESEVDSDVHRDS